MCYNIIDKYALGVFIFMLDEHLCNVDKVCTHINSLSQKKRSLFVELKCTENQINEFDDLSQNRNEELYLNGLQQQSEILEQRIKEVDAKKTEISQSMFEAGFFQTKKLTKYLANVLTKETGVQWLPIRFLIEPKTAYKPQVEGYGVLLAESMHTLPNLADTITLLDSFDRLPMLRYDLKYKENGYGETTKYSNIDDLDNIWMFGPRNFICIGANSEYSAFFNLNPEIEKPFLHLPLTQNEQTAIHSFNGDFKCYPKYDEPNLPVEHPRFIALKALAGIVEGRLEKSLEQKETNEHKHYLSLSK